MITSLKDYIRDWIAMYDAHEPSYDEEEEENDEGMMMDDAILDYLVIILEENIDQATDVEVLDMITGFLPQFSSNDLMDFIHLVRQYMISQVHEEPPLLSVDIMDRKSKAEIYHECYPKLSLEVLEYVVYTKFHTHEDHVIGQYLADTTAEEIVAEFESTFLGQENLEMMADHATDLGFLPEVYPQFSKDTLEFILLRKCGYDLAQAAQYILEQDEQEIQAQYEKYQVQFWVQLRYCEIQIFNSEIFRNSDIQFSYSDIPFRYSDI